MSKWDKAIEQICEGVKPTMRSKSTSEYNVDYCYHDSTLVMCMDNISSVEIVRCKDCKNYEHIVTAIDNERNVTKECDFCNHWKRIIDVNDYCSYGMRKEYE